MRTGAANERDDLVIPRLSPPAPFRSARFAPAGLPAARGEFDRCLHNDRLLPVRDGCRPEDREGLFVRRHDPADPGPFRRQYGFENRSFRFRVRALDPGDPCVARVFLPGYHDLFPSAAAGDADRDPNSDRSGDGE